MKLTPDEIKERLRANGNPSIFEEQVLRYIEKLERENELYRTVIEKYEHD